MRVTLQLIRCLIPLHAYRRMIAMITIMIPWTLLQYPFLMMLARVPIISAYDPSRESMLAYASPSYKIAIMIIGLVIDCLGQITFS